MRRWIKPILLSSLVLAVAGCVQDREMRKREIAKFMQTVVGEYRNDAGDTLVMVPVYARMIGLDTLYVERTTPKGTSGRLVSMEISSDGNHVVQMSYVFTQQAQWRNLIAQPELLSALQPNDVRPAGSCDIKLAEDSNSVSYVCAGGTPQTYKRVQHAVPD
jgi:CpeT/CpcT family protein DUF1001